MGILTGPWGFDCAYRKITKLIPNTYSLIIYVAAVRYMICDKDNTQKCGRSTWKVLGGWVRQFCSWWMGRINWPVGQQVNPLASGLTYSPSPTHWPTPYNWRVGYNSTLISAGKPPELQPQDENSSIHNFLLNEDNKLYLVWHLLRKAIRSQISGQYNKLTVVWNDVDGLPGNYT